MIVAFLVVLMVAVGGITRLTESGLSITQWKPITGAIPPLSEAAWQAEFALYQTTGEYQTVTGPAGMDRAAFKFIFFWEWFHRLLGRLIGLAFAVPLAWFWMRGAIPQGYKGRLVALLALGGLQGVFGWFMVRSGLAGTMTDVSHFWLSIHLLTALFTLGGLIWTALDLRQLATGASRPARWTGTASWEGAILFVQLLLGAWVAGLNAGLASDTWPLMQGQLVPEYDRSRGLAWAVTHWKAQGMTLARARVRVGRNVAGQPGVAFVAVTRVGHSWHLMFDTDLPDFEAFDQARYKEEFRSRERFDLRLKATQSRTLRKYGDCSA